jgi:hypothetical protein
LLGRDSSVPPGKNSGPHYYTGRFTAWGNFNQNGRTVESGFTFNLTRTGSDGLKISVHNNEHFNQRPDGTTHGFFHCH